MCVCIRNPADVYASHFTNCYHSPQQPTHHTQAGNASRARLLGALSTGLNTPRAAALARTTAPQLLADVLGGIVDAVELRRRELAAREAERGRAGGDVLSAAGLRFEVEAVDLLAAVAAPMAASVGGLPGLMPPLMHAAAAAFARIARCG